jgi:hypothetical protein
VDFLSKRKIILSSLLIGILVVLFVCYKYFNKIEKRDMAEYVPDSAAAFLEINSLSNLFSEIIKTDAWQKLASQFGISKQVEYLTTAADVLSFTGLAPAEANLLATAQYALVLDNLELNSQENPDIKESSESSESSELEKGAGQLEIIPRFALVIETHSRASKVEEYLGNRVSLLAQRIYSNKVTSKEENFGDIKIKIFESEEKDRKIISAQKGSVLIIGNSLSTVKKCLNVLLGQEVSFKNNPNLKLARERISQDSMVFGFIKRETLSKILQISTAFLPTLSKISNSENQTLPSIISLQLLEGLAYSASFKDGEVVEQYFALIKPDLAERLTLSIKPSSKALNLTPKLRQTSLDFTVLLVERPSEFLEEIVQTISSKTDVVISFALRQLVIELGKKYGISPDDPIGDLISNEVALIKLVREEKQDFLIMLPVSDKFKALPSIGRYLRKGTEKLVSEDYKGFEIVSNPEFESRAIAFLDGYLVLGTKEELVTFIDLWKNSNLVQTNKNNLEFLRNFTLMQKAIFLSSKVEKNKLADFFLAISKLLRTTDGSKEILESDAIKSVLENLHPTTSIGALTDEGLMIEKRSALGVFIYISNFFDMPASELQETQKPK